jgi:PBSX family phage portal protein
MPEAPSGEARERITKAVAAESDAPGRVAKVLFFDEAGEPVGDWHSTQVPEDPFTSYRTGLREPPYPMEQLVFLAESHPVHTAALEQKTIDILGRGLEWVPIDENQPADDAFRDELHAWWEDLGPVDSDIDEQLYQAELDHQTIGWGLLEVVRDPSGNAKKLYHVPGHTVRAHRNGYSLCQRRDARRQWFRRWGAPDVNGKRIEVDSKTGSITRVSEPANDLLVIKRPAQRSSWYGIPTYVSAIGWITLALAARDDNLMFFTNRREPRWAIVMNNLADDPDIEDDIRRAFTVDLRYPYRNIIIPITGPGKIDFQKLTDTKQDGSFDRLGERADKAIMIAHRVPAERLANAEVGPLGGHRTEAASRVYKESVVQPGQEFLAKRLNRFIDVEYKKATTKAGKPKPTKPLPWKVALRELDIETDREEVSLAVMEFHGDLITLREARHKLGYGPLLEQERDENGNPIGDPVESEFNDMIFSELPGAAGSLGTPGALPVGSGGLLHNARELQELDDLRSDVRTLYLTAREQHSEIADLLAAARES